MRFFRMKELLSLAKRGVNRIPLPTLLEVVSSLTMCATRVLKWLLPASGNICVCVYFFDGL